jgi:DNA mismatch repair ATPase MutS
MLENMQVAQTGQADLFAPAFAPADLVQTHPLHDAILQELSQLDPDTLTPKAALEWLYQLKQKL